MIRTILKILIAVAVLNAVARAGMAAWSYYQLRDEAQQVILFGARASTTELADQILIKAMALDVPLEPQDLEVRREGNRTLVDASYTQPVEFFPTLIYPIDLSFSLESFAVRTGP